MGSYLIRRILLIFPTLFGIMLINFAVIQIEPGGPVEQMLAQMTGTAVESTARFSGAGEGEVDASFDASSFEDVDLCGLGSRDTLRLEAALCLYGNELNESINPKQANLMWTIPNIRRQKSDFYGSENIINTTYKKNDKIRVGIESISKSIPRSNFKIFNEQNSLIGEVTSGSFSPSLKKPIAMAYIEYEFSEVGNEVYIESRGTKEKGIITKLPFVSHNYKK